MSSAVTFASPQEALATLHAAMGYLAAADAAGMGAGAQAEVLLGLERLDAMETAARASVLGAFTAGQGHHADGAYSPKSWLIHQAKVTKAAAIAHVTWARRAEAHPRIAALLAAGDITESYARAICGWTDKLPADCRDAVDGILAGAALGGTDLAALAGLFARIRDACQPADGDGDGTFDDRGVRLETTFGGAGVLRGELTPDCAAALSAVLDALSAPAGAQDTRSRAERCHDALADALQRLLASGLLPDRAGHPAKAWAHISLAEMLAMDGSSALLAQWAGEIHGQWAAARAGASVGGGDGAAWLDGQAARAFTCDASLTPVVTGEVNYEALDGLVRLCVELARIEHAERARDGGLDDAPAPPTDGAAAQPPDGGPDGSPAAAGSPGSARSREALQLAIIGKAVDLLSGPGGLASFLRTRQLGARLNGPSFPLDIGYSRDIPAGIRQAVLLRARGHCEWAGGCRQPAAACQIHHVKHKADGGPTSVRMCVLLCFFHHQVCVHRWGWTLVVNPDGTTTAWSPDKTKVLRSHGPPAATSARYPRLTQGPP